MSTNKWKTLLKELRTCALRVNNQNAANEEILGIQYLPVTHSDNHMEEINPTLHALLGWGRDGGVLSRDASRADFLAIHDWMYQLFEHEKHVSSQQSCLAAIEPRLENALEIW